MPTLRNNVLHTPYHHRSPEFTIWYCGKLATLTLVLQCQKHCCCDLGVYQIILTNKHFLLHHQNSLVGQRWSHVWVWQWNRQKDYGCVFCVHVPVPVFIPVDSPDHSNTNAHSSQYERPHWEVPVSDREAGKKHRRSNKQRLSAVEACLPAGVIQRKTCWEEEVTHTALLSSHCHHNVLFRCEKGYCVYGETRKSIQLFWAVHQVVLIHTYVCVYI